MLREAGLDAVPLLIDHLHDYRLTRTIQSSWSGHYIWHVRVADVVAILLNGLVSEEFSYDFLAKEGRGKSLDRAHVLFWWSQAQGHARSAPSKADASTGGNETEASK